MAEVFRNRHIGTDSAAQRAMLDLLGHASPSDVVLAAMPSSILAPRLATSIVPPAASEREALAELRAIAGKNTVTTALIGLGYSETITPAVIQRNVLENPSWYTAYTPYQPEISQGRLEALLNFQTVVAELTGTDVANSSMLDEGTAAVEGMLLARRAAKSRSSVFIVDADALPQTKALLAVRAEPIGIELVELPLCSADPAELPEAFGVLIQYPGASGLVWNPAHVVEAVHAAKGMAVVAADLLALTLLTPPGEWGADVVVGSSQRFGVPMGFGGPHAGYLAVRTGLERQLPGRLVGVSKDATGHLAYRLALQTREQHIRREKATSNICTAQVLLAVMAGMYAVYHGPAGLRQIAAELHDRTRALAASLEAAGFPAVHSAYFDTLRVRVVGGAAAVVAGAEADGVSLLLADQDTVGISLGEGVSDKSLDIVLRAFSGRSDARIPRAPSHDTDAFANPLAELDEDLDYATALPAAIPESLRRTSDFLQHEVFHAHHSETSMMRYLKRLADYDYALDRGMIPLGSCTMKLNAATEMTAVTWPEFATLHPFAPVANVAGYLELIEQLEGWLAELTGYDSVSVQPNAGSQGELAGLLAIRGYHRSRGDLDRTVCLIPSSAHGTNAASAVLAGMRVVVVACDEWGNVDLDDLRAKIAEHAETLSALMITYPSTHGVYEEAVTEICDAVHEAGGQVYVDGANLNALVGFAKPGQFGGDVSHLNLHKTFCIPHGGGGPGVGPVAARAHLAPFLPGHPQAQRQLHGGGPVSAAPYGSPSILPITWAYIRMMGVGGLTEATAAAVLSANYLATKLEPYFPVLYTGEAGLVAHECILDLRPLKEATGVTVEDVAKRLIDYGFHAPTMSFPVVGTLMIEPTESEDLAELDRFVDAMIAIRREADAVGAGVWPADDNPLVNAPHTAQSLVQEWAHPYDRERAVYPASLGWDAASARDGIKGKYWPPVRRIDQSYGDRNLVCACPPPEAFE